MLERGMSNVNVNKTGSGKRLSLSTSGGDGEGHGESQGPSQGQDQGDAVVYPQGSEMLNVKPKVPMAAEAAAVNLQAATKVKPKHFPVSSRVTRSDFKSEKEYSDTGFVQLLDTLANEDKFDIRILRLKNEGLQPMATEVMLDKVIEALGRCTTVQVLYIQNFVNGMRDRQVASLIEVLKKGYIWGLNIGESTNVSREMWQTFAKELRHTNVTHMYASEGTLLTAKEKTDMMDAVRENRKKHKRYFDLKNRDVIDRVSNMWFNPRASGKYQAQFFGSRLCDKVYDLKLFTPGTICWARIKGKLFWPSIVLDVNSAPARIAEQAKPDSVLVRFLNDPDTEADHAFVNGNMIQPWVFQRVSEKLLMRRPVYRRAVIQAMLLYFGRKKHRSKYERWMEILVRNSNAAMLENCALVDSILPGKDSTTFGVGSIVWHENYPAAVKEMRDGGKSMQIEYFGEEKQVAFVKPDAIKKLCASRAPEKMMLRNGKLQRAIEDVGNHISLRLKNMIPEGYSDAFIGVFFYRARQAFLEANKPRTKLEMMPGLSPLLSRQLNSLTAALPSFRETPSCLDPTVNALVNVAASAVKSSNMNRLMKLCEESGEWKAVAWDEAHELCVFVRSPLEGEDEGCQLLALCVGEMPLRLLVQPSSCKTMVSEDEVKTMLGDEFDMKVEDKDRVACPAMAANVELSSCLRWAEARASSSGALAKFAARLRDLKVSCAGFRCSDLLSNLTGQVAGLEPLVVENIKIELIPKDNVEEQVKQEKFEMKFNELWRLLRKIGWRATVGDRLSNGHFYLAPGTADKQSGVEGETLMKGEDALLAFVQGDKALQNKLIELREDEAQKADERARKRRELVEVADMCLDIVEECVTVALRKGRVISVGAERKRKAEQKKNPAKRRKIEIDPSIVKFVEMRKSSRHIGSSAKLCARPECNEVVTGTYCTIRCKQIHLKEGSPPRQNTVKPKQKRTPNKPTQSARPIVLAQRSRRKPTETKTCANPVCREHVSGKC